MNISCPTCKATVLVADHCPLCGCYLPGGVAPPHRPVRTMPQADSVPAAPQKVGAGLAAFLSISLLLAVVFGAIMFAPGRRDQIALDAEPSAVETERTAAAPISSVTPPPASSQELLPQPEPKPAVPKMTVNVEPEPVLPQPPSDAELQAPQPEPGVTAQPEKPQADTDPFEKPPVVEPKPASPPAIAIGTAVLARLERQRGFGDVPSWEESMEALIRVIKERAQVCEDSKTDPILARLKTVLEHLGDAISPHQYRQLQQANRNLAGISCEAFNKLLTTPQEAAGDVYIARFPVGRLPCEARPLFMRWRPGEGWQLMTWSEPVACISRVSLERARSSGLVSYRDDEIAWLCHESERVHARSYPDGTLVIELPDAKLSTGVWETGRFLVHVPGQGWSQRHD